MRIDKGKLSTWNRFLPQRIRLKKVRGYEIEGVDNELEKHHTHWFTIVGTLFAFFIPFLVLLYGIGIISYLTQQHIWEKLLDWKQTVHISWLQWHYFKDAFHFWGLCILDFMFSFTFAFHNYRKLLSRFDPLIKGEGQKGDSRLATIEEIEQQYPKIPDSKKRYQGIGGFPISHYHNHYYIETATMNSLVIGTSRSGKGEMIVVPMIDILARASDQCSMVVNDPKGELYASAKDTLENYGYEVQVLNLLDPMNSMSFNPLQIIKEAYLDGELDRAEDLTNSFSHMMFDDPKAGQNAWVNKGAEAMCTGLILGLLEKCDKDGDLEKFNLYNVGQMLIELGNVSFSDDNQGEQEKSYLDAYFDSLPEGDKAKAQYASSSLGGGNGKRTIVSSVVEKFRLYQLGNISKMTSKNSFELKSLGFPKYLTVHFDPSLKLYRDKILVEIIDLNYHTIFSDYIKPNLDGVASINFDCSIETGYMLKLSYNNQSITYYLKLESNHKTVGLTPSKSHCAWQGVLSINMKYSEKPIAVFMVTPDYDTSKNPIASTFVDQVYDSLMKNASKTRGKKCHRRVHFILDEFGNMPALSKLENKLTVCLSRNVLFNLILQSYDQLYSVYGKEVGNIAKENCQNKVLIKTMSQDTLKEFCHDVGKRTVESVSRDRKVSDFSSPSHVSISEEDVLPIERIADFVEGEMLVIRKLHRQDNQRHRVRAYPIFDHGETEMPYRYQFLAEDYDMDKDINDLDVASDHRDLDIQSVSMDFEAWRKEIRDHLGKADMDELVDDGLSPSEDSQSHNDSPPRNDELFKRKLMNRYVELNQDSSILDKFFQLMDSSSESYQSLQLKLEQMKSNGVSEALINDLMKYVEDYREN